MVSRSPRYPRHSLSKAIDLTKKLFAGAHRSRVDVDTAAKLIGYASSSGGAAASALGALRQFGLVDGLRGSVGVSDLALKIIQPLDEAEKRQALVEAASNPEIFGKVLRHFDGKLPPTDEAPKALLIRNEGFSPAGAKELLDSLRETLRDLPLDSENHEPSQVGVKAEDSPANDGNVPAGRSAQAAPAENPSSVEGADQLIILPLGSDCRAELRFVGEVTPAVYGRLIRHLELLKETIGDVD